MAEPVLSKADCTHWPHGAVKVTRKSRRRSPAGRLPFDELWSKPSDAQTDGRKPHRIVKSVEYAVSSPTCDFGEAAGKIDMAAPIGTIRSYDDLLALARARMAALNITFETLDAVAGTQPGYSAKILGPHPSRKLGHMSFAAIFGALGVEIRAYEDRAALARIRDRLVPRKLRRARRHWRHREPDVRSANDSQRA